MIEVAVGGRGQFECAEADVVQSLVVNTERLVCILNQLVDRQGRVVRLYHRVRHLQYHVLKPNKDLDENSSLSYRASQCYLQAATRNK